MEGSKTVASNRKARFNYEILEAYELMEENNVVKYLTMIHFHIGSAMNSIKPLKKALREDGESEEVIRLIKKIRKVKVYTVQNASDKMVAQFSRQSFGSNLQELMSVNSKDSKIKIMSAITDSDTMIKDLLITVRDEKELVYVKVLGKFSLEDISRIAEISKKNKDTVANN